MRPALILEPQSVPVVGTDAHLPALSPASLTAALVTERFSRPTRWLPEFPGDAPSPEAVRSRSPVDAAVLVALVQRDDGLRVLLTRRTAHLRDHGGQISFPGGRSETVDAGPEDTALREAEEEVGLARGRAAVIGRLPVYTTITNFVVTPVVAVVQPPLGLVIDRFEVDEAFEVPLAFLMDPANHHRHRFEVDGSERHFLSMPWRVEGAGGVRQTYFIWGATAAMLRNLYRFLAG